MAPYTANRNSCAPRLTRPSALSSDLRMPHVFVIPPEEEQQDNPPWCCFDADEQPENNGGFPSNLDTRFLDPSYHLQQSEQDAPTPIAHSPGHQLRLRVPISKKLEKKQRPEAIKIIENESYQARHRDSDVIEVVKVKRSREALTDLEENINVKRSKTLKMRATRALQTIKGVGKGSHRTHVKELWTSSESMPGIFKGVQEQIRSQCGSTEHHHPLAPPAKKGSLSRSNSRSLSQIFQPAKPSRPDFSSVACPAPSVALAKAHSVLPTANSSSLSHLRYNNTNPSLSGASSTLTINDALNRPASLRPSMRKNTKFSVRGLHRLFSFSSSPDDPSSGPTATTAPLSSTRGNSTPLASSIFSFDYLDAPMKDDDIYSDARLLGLEDANRKPASQYPQPFRIHHDDDDISPPHDLSDLSFEMRLDSLHFDALSFDPKDFDVPMEGDTLR